MRKLIFILIGLALVGLSGCATPVSDLFNGGAGEETRSEIGSMVVTSNPSDAEIYLNDKLVGRTPSQSVPFSYQYKIWRQPMGLGYTNPYGAMSDNVLRISKKGYKDVFEPIDPQKTKYHFELEAENAGGVVSQAGESPALALQAFSYGQVIGRVTAINSDYNFIIIEINPGRDASINQVLDVVREQKQIAQVRVIGLKTDVFSAEVQPGSNIGAIRRGDQVMSQR